MVSEVSHNIREAVGVLAPDAVHEASGHIVAGARLAIEALRGAGNEDTEMAIELLEGVAENEIRSQILLRRGASLLTEYADILDGTGSAVSQETTPSLPKSHPARLAMPTVSTRWIRQQVDDVIQRQQAEIAAGSPPAPAGLGQTGEPHISNYDDGEPFTLSPYGPHPDEIYVPTLHDLMRVLQAVQYATNCYCHDWAVDEVLQHEAEHAELDTELVRQFGATRVDGSRQLGHALRLIVHAPPAKNPENGVEYIPSTPTLFTVLSNIKVPAIAIALAAMFPREPSSIDKDAVKRQGFRGRGDVLRRVDTYNQRPGVLPLPLPKQ